MIAAESGRYPGRRRLRDMFCDWMGGRAVSYESEEGSTAWAGPLPLLQVAGILLFGIDRCA